jgi:hypothetical protein
MRSKINGADRDHAIARMAAERVAFPGKGEHRAVVGWIGRVVQQADADGASVTGQHLNDCERRPPR